MDYEGILARLTHVKKEGRYWCAVCPVRPGRHNRRSFRLWLGARGQLIARCYACGAVFPEIVRALGTKYSDWFPPEPERPRRKPIVPDRILARYPFRTASGDLLFEEVRLQPFPGQSQGWRLLDDVVQAGPDDLILDAVPLAPYHLPELAERPDDPVLICYSSDTEMLTSEGWLPFPALTGSERVAQFSPEHKEVSFVTPSAVQHLAYDGPMVNIKADFSDLLVTPDHRVLVGAARCHDRVVPASEVRNQQSLPLAGFCHAHSDSPTPEQVRVLVAFAADATICRGFQLAWNFKKERKILRLRDTLRAAGVPWTERNWKSAPGYTVLTVDRRQAPFILHWFPDKRIHVGCLSWSLSARRALLEEIGHWDGDFSGQRGVRFFTAKKDEADAVSAIAAITGWGSIMRTVPVRDGCDPAVVSPEHILSLLVNTDRRTLGNRPIWLAGYAGHVHCCTVPSGFLVTRRNGKVTVAGNCEGPRDADTLASLGFLSSCSPCGARNWKPSYGVYFEGRRVTVIPDADQDGEVYAMNVLGSLLLHGARSIRLVRLGRPGGPKDASEWLARRLGGKRTPDALEAARYALKAMIRNAPEWKSVVSERTVLRGVDHRLVRDRR